MQKLFLFKSDEDYRDQTGDVFVSLKHITSIKLLKHGDDNYIVCAEINDERGFVARFPSDKKARSFMHSLFEAMGENPEMLDKLKCFKMDRKKEELLNILGKIKDKLSD